MAVVSPADFVAFAEDQGLEYPDSAAEKARLLPKVLEWKADRDAEAAATRSPSPLQVGILSGGLAAAGIGGVALFNRLRRQGVSPEAAAAAAAAVEERATPASTQAARPPAQAAEPLESAPPVADWPLAYFGKEQSVSNGPNATAVIRKSVSGKSGSKRSVIDRQVGALAGATNKGTTQERANNVYKVNTLWSDPEIGPQLALATTPELREKLLNRMRVQRPDIVGKVADALADRYSGGVLSPNMRSTEDELPQADRLPEGTVIQIERRDSNGDFISYGDKLAVVNGKYQSASARGVKEKLERLGRLYDGVLESEIGADDEPLTGSRFAGKPSAQPGYLPADEGQNALITSGDRKGVPIHKLTEKAKNEGVRWNLREMPDKEMIYVLERFDKDDDGNLLETSVPVRFGDRDAAKFLQAPISWSQLVKDWDNEDNGSDERSVQALLDPNDRELYDVSEYNTPPATAYNPKALQMKDQFGWDRLPARVVETPDGQLRVEHARWEPRRYEGGVYTGKTVADALAVAPADDSFEGFDGFGSQLTNAAHVFNKVHRQGVVPMATLQAISNRFQVPPREIAETAARLRGDMPLPQASGYAAPQANAVGGRSNRDWVTQLLSAAEVTPRASTQAVREMLLSNDPQQISRAARGWLNANPDIVGVLNSNLKGLTGVEKLSMVQEAINDAALDFPAAVSWANSQSPELAERLQQPDAPTFDQFARSYVRRHVIGTALEASSDGVNPPLLTIPKDVGELVAQKALRTGQSVDKVLGGLVGHLRSPADAAWRLDGLISNAASGSLNESYTAGSKLAEGFWDSASPEDATRVGNLKARLGARAGYGSAAHAGVGARMPIDIQFGSAIAGSEGGLLNRDDAFVDRLIVDAVKGDVRQYRDPSVINPELQASERRQTPLEMEMGGRDSQFPLNKKLSNMAKSLASQQAELTEAVNSKSITPAEAKARQDMLDDKMKRVVEYQRRIDASRATGERLLSLSNRFVQDDNGGIARRYSLDLNPDTGNVQVVPSMPIAPRSLEGLLESQIDRGEAPGDNIEGMTNTFAVDADGLTPAERFLDSSLDAVSADETGSGKNDIDVWRQYGHGTSKAKINFKSLGPGQDTYAGGEPEYQRAIAELRRQGYGPGYNTVQAESLVTPELVKRVARANHDRLNSNSSASGDASYPVGEPQAPPMAATAEELNAAATAHLHDWFARIKPEFDRAGRQVSGWAGGDSWRGGARLAGRADRNVMPYQAPSQALLERLAAVRRAT